MPPRSESGPRSVREIARGSSALQQALRRAETYLALNARLSPSLPETVRRHVRVACIENETLVIAAGSAAWATQARMHQGRLLAAAQTLWPEPLNAVRVIIAPSLETDGG